MRVTEVAQPNGSSAYIVTVPGTNGLETFPGSINGSEDDDGGGGKGPVIYGKFTVTGDSLAVLDDAPRTRQDVIEERDPITQPGDADAEHVVGDNVTANARWLGSGAAGGLAA